jgi:hypothetical protein
MDLLLHDFVLASITGVFEAMACAESDDSHGSAQKRGTSSISGVERKPARFAMDQHASPDTTHSAVPKAVK